LKQQKYEQFTGYYPEKLNFDEWELLMLMLFIYHVIVHLFPRLASQT